MAYQAYDVDQLLKDAHNDFDTALNAARTALSDAPSPFMANLVRARHPILRQSVRDYLVNQQFRRDIFAKGSRRLLRAGARGNLQQTIVCAA